MSYTKEIKHYIKVLNEDLDYVKEKEFKRVVLQQANNFIKRIKEVKEDEN